MKAAGCEGRRKEYAEADASQTQMQLDADGYSRKWHQATPG
jgi:hypothetical protein